MTWEPGGEHLDAPVKQYGPLNFKRRAVRKLRKEVYERDGYRCQLCGYEPREIPENYDGGPGFHQLWELQIDHILSRFRGGDNGIGNLQTLCVKCNARKGVR